MASFKTGDKVMVGSPSFDRAAMVEKIDTKVEDRYYVRYIKADGTPSKVGTWCRLSHMKPAE